MPDRTNNNAGREWTVMFYMAADNPLAPIMVSQLKAIKDAGFQENTDVLVYFDPNELGAPTCLYHVNKKRREKSGEKTLVGDAANSFVRNMLEDDLDLSSAKGPAAVDEKRLRPPGHARRSEIVGSFSRLLCGGTPQ